jgi:predicted PurR-regulated permease PerM
MALPIREQAKYWGIAAALFLAALWLLDTVILPFVVGGAVAYFLDPVADRLQRLGMGRATATTLIAIGLLFLVVLLVLAVIPTLVTQLTQLINALPELFRQLQIFLLERFPQLADETSTARQTLAQIGETLRARGGELVQALVGGAVGIVNAVVFMVVVPVVSFYLLLDWERLIARIDGWLPRDHAPVIRRLAGEIDAVLAAFVRGQISVCLILGTFYAVALALTGLQFGLVVGALAGAISFIPYVGSLVGGALAIGLALFQFWNAVPVTDAAGVVTLAPDWLRIGLVAGIFFVGQFLEGNFITPKLVGESVGLHPVWLLFALSAFGALFGFLGLLVAVPVAAAIGVLARFGLQQYTESLLYRGSAPPPPAEAEPPPDDGPPPAATP